MRRTSRLTRKALTLMSLLAVVGGSVFVAGGVNAADEASTGITAVGKLPRFPADAIAAFGDIIIPKTEPFPEANKIAQGGTLIGVPQRGELWQLYPTKSDSGEVLVAVRSMASLKMIATVRIPVPLLRGTTFQGGDWMHAFDGDRRIFFMEERATEVIEVDLVTHAVRRRPLGPPVVVAGLPTTGILPGSMNYDPQEKALVMLFGGVVSLNVANTETFVYRLFDDDRTDFRKLRSCGGPLPPRENATTSPVETLITEEYFYFPCQRAGSIGAVVRVARRDLSFAGSAEDVVVGPAYLETVIADPVSKRLFLVTLSGEIWAFDTETMSFVGVIAAAAEGLGNVDSGYGFDKVTGRLFFLSNTYGLGIAEGRYFPIPQARMLAGAKAPGQERIISDPVSGRFFVLRGRQLHRDDAYTIYSADAASQPPPPPDPDLNTTDVEEKEGLTESRYFANGTGYGFRTLLAKGIVTVPPAPTLGQVSPTAQVINDHVNSKCGYTDRELVGARIARAEYDSGSTSAKAVGFDVDDRTKVDLEHLERCDIVIKDNNGGEAFKGFYSTSPTADLLRGFEATNDPGKRWESRGASCSSSAGGETVTEPSVMDDSTTDCPKPGDEMTAKATAKFEGKHSVGRTETKTTIKRTATGVVSEVVAEAEDITVNLEIPGMGLIRIGEITSKATSRANGRPNRRDMSTHEVTISGVRVGGTTICVSNCAIDEVARRLTTLAGGRADFRTVTGLDQDLLRGTPKGALTAVQKSTARQASDQALVGDFTTEVPALEILVYNDNGKFGRARQLYQFAGVATAATYNISVLPTGSGFPGDSSFDEDALSPSGGIDGFLSGTGGGAGSPIASLGGGGGESIIERVVSALARGLRMFFGNPRHALLLLTAWSLLSLPPVLSRRRRLLDTARSV